MLLISVGPTFGFPLYVSDLPLRTPPIMNRFDMTRAHPFISKYLRNWVKDNDTKVSVAPSHSVPMSFVWHLSLLARAHARTGPKCSGRRLRCAVELGGSEWRTDMRARPMGNWNPYLRICRAENFSGEGRGGEGRLELEGGCALRRVSANRMGSYGVEEA